MNFTTRILQFANRHCERCLSFAALFACLAALPASAALIDFETDPFGATPIDDAFLPSGSPYNFPGLQVSFGFDLNSDNVLDADGRFEAVGSSGLDTIGGFSGSSGSDTADPGFGPQLGNWFLKSPNPGLPFGRFVIQYSSIFPVTACSGEIWDIDGQPQTGVTEEYTLQAFDSSNALLGTIVSPLGVLDTPSAPLDGQPWVFAFSGLSAGIDHIVITFTGTKPSGIGLAFNNFNPIAAPEPTSAILVLLGAALSALAMRRRRGQTLLAGALVLCSLAGGRTVEASTIVFDNLDPTPSPYYYALGGAWTGNFTSTIYATSGMNFTPSASGQLDELTLGLINIKNNGSLLSTLVLSPEVSGMPSAPIWSGTYTLSSTFGSLLSVTGIGGPMLTGGQTYWLEAAAPHDGFAIHGWYSNTQGDIGSVIGAGTFFANAQRWALRVGVIPKNAPEPSTALIGCSLAAGAACCRPPRRRCRR